MKFPVRTENQIAAMNLWPKGEYDFEVVKAEPAKSGPTAKVPGTEFIKINVRIFNDEGQFRFVNGILHPAMEAQLRHFCVVGGRMKEYEAGTLTADECIGVAGRLKLKIKPEQGSYPAKNEIADFIVPKIEVAEAEAQPEAPGDDDSMPF